MGELCRYKEEVAFLEPFKGTINTKNGQKYVESIKAKIGNDDFIVSKNGLSVWIKIRKRKGNPFIFSMPISQMHDVKKVKEKTKTGELRTYIIYTMTKSMHYSATFGKKDKDGKRIFKPKPSCLRCGNYQERAKSGYSQSGSGRSI